MSERKVLNKYFPPDFDPSIIPRQKKPKNDQYKVRLMAPFNMRCITCGVYIYKATKFNARKETVEGEEYLGIKIFRFYIRCPKCHQEITFKTDPENADYVPENGITRNFELWREVEDEVEAKKKKKEDEEENNAMKALENRTKQSKKEMDMLDTLEEIRDMNARNAAVDVNELIQQKNDALVKELQDQEKRDEEEIAKIFNSSATVVDDLDNTDAASAPDGPEKQVVAQVKQVKVKRLAESDSDEDQATVRKRAVFGQAEPVNKKKAKTSRAEGLMVHSLTDHSGLDTEPTGADGGTSSSTGALANDSTGVVKKNKPKLGALLGIVKKVEKPAPVVSTGLAGLGGYGSSSEDST